MAPHWVLDPLAGSPPRPPWLTHLMLAKKEGKNHFEISQDSFVFDSTNRKLKGGKPQWKKSTRNHQGNIVLLLLAVAGTLPWR